MNIRALYTFALGATAAACGGSDAPADPFVAQDDTPPGASSPAPGGAGPGSDGAGGDSATGPTDGGAVRPKGPRKTSPQPLHGVPDGFYPRLVLRADGTIVASVVRFLPASGRMGASFFESKDGGVSFAAIGNLDDPRTQGGLCCGTLYELPKPLGAMPAGTLLFSASAGGDAPNAPMTLPVWKSGDGGRTWAFVANVAVGAVPRKNGGLWEPELAMLDDGSLTCHWSDETQGAVHSQKLVVARSTDGVTWTGKHDTVAVLPQGHRPGMPNVRRPPGGPFVLSYEICGVAGDSCTAWFRTSDDGWTWGDPASPGFRPTTLDGRHFRHAPTLAFSPKPGAGGRFFLVGQMTHRADGTVAPDNGKVLFANSERGYGAWYPVPAPVPVPDAYDNFCPNYSSTLLPLEDGTVGLEIASRWDGNVCRSYFARGPLIETTDASEITAGDYRLVSLQSNLCLDVAGGSTAAGANVQQYGCNGLTAQRWKVTRSANGDVALAAAVSGMCLTVAGNAAAPGANVVQQPCGGAGQAWTLRNVGVGHYELRHAGTGSCLDVAGGSKAQGGNVAQWTCNDLAPQIWRLDRL